MQAHSDCNGKWTLPPQQFPPRTFPPPCSVRVRVRSGVSRARVGSVGLGLIELVLGLGLGLWSSLGGNVREGKCLIFYGRAVSTRDSGAVLEVGRFDWTPLQAYGDCN